MLPSGPTASPTVRPTSPPKVEMRPVARSMRRRRRFSVSATYSAPSWPTTIAWGWTSFPAVAGDGRDRPVGSNLLDVADVDRHVEVAGRIDGDPVGVDRRRHARERRAVD